MAKTAYVPPRTFQDLILTLQRYWAERGCVIMQPYDMEMGAGTFHPATFLRALGPEPWSAAYVQPSRRPTDGRYGDNPFRLQHYYQYQVAIKPSPPDMIDLYLGSLRAVGIDPLVHDIRLVEDNWESPTLGAWGLGWEIWLNGMEVTQFTYFQQVGGLDCRPVMGEITYGLERLAMYLQGVESVFDLVWTDGPLGRVTYGDVYHQNEVEQSQVQLRARERRRTLPPVRRLRGGVPAAAGGRSSSLPAYERMLKTSHTFNLLDARKAISVTERQRYILRVRTLARGVAEAYYASREALGFPDAAGRPAPPVAARGSAPAREGPGHRGPGMSAYRDFLVEIGTEELPPKSLLDAVARVRRRRGQGARGGGPGAPSRRAHSPRRAGWPCGCGGCSSSSPTGRSNVAARRSRRRSTRRVRRRRPPSPSRAGCGVDVAALEKTRDAKGRMARVPRHRIRRTHASTCCPPSCRRRSTRCRSRGACAGARARRSSCVPCTGC